MVDRLLEPDVGKACAFRAEVALRGEAGFERAARMDDGACGAERERLMQDLIVPERLVVRVQEEVRVPLDHAGHEGGAGQLDGAGARGGREVRPRRSDLVALYEYRPAFVRLRVHAVEHASGVEEEGVGERRNGGKQRHHERREQSKHGKR